MEYVIERNTISEIFQSRTKYLFNKWIQLFQHIISPASQKKSEDNFQNSRLRLVYDSQDHRYILTSAVSVRS